MLCQAPACQGAQISYLLSQNSGQLGQCRLPEPEPRQYFGLNQEDYYTATNLERSASVLQCHAHLFYLRLGTLSGRFEGKPAETQKSVLGAGYSFFWQKDPCMCEVIFAVSRALGVTSNLVWPQPQHGMRERLESSCGVVARSERSSQRANHLKPYILFKPC